MRYIAGNTGDGLRPTKRSRQSECDAGVGDPEETNAKRPRRKTVLATATGLAGVTAVAVGQTMPEISGRTRLTDPRLHSRQAHLPGGHGEHELQKA